MTINSPTFNVQEFELRGQASPYLTDTQSEAVNTVETRVNGQLDWLAQLLGWSSPNYWSSLVYSVSQKRQLLGGFGGVYNSYTLPRVLEVRNWSDEIVIEKTAGIDTGLTCYLGEKTATISGVTVDEKTFTLSFSNISEGFFDEFAFNAQLKIDIPANRPEPFVRPTPGISADASFSCKAEGSSLVLYPSWDTNQLNPYKFNFLIAGSRYYFNQPVYLSNSLNSPSPAVETKYDPLGEVWYFDVPLEANAGVGMTGYLVWPYADPSVQSDVTCEVNIFSWADPSDWNTRDILQNFTGVWGNKGGPLPFNFCFDSLSLCGFDENKSIYLAPIERTLLFNDLIQLVYQGQVDTRLEYRGPRYVGASWWNPNTGAFSVLPPEVNSAGAWVEIQFPEGVDIDEIPDYTYPTVADFAANASNIAPGATVRIADVTGLQADGGTYFIQGITSPLPAPGTVILYSTGESNYFTVYEFLFANTSNFSSNARYLPIGTKVKLLNSASLQPEVSGSYLIQNLRFTISASLETEVELTKYYDEYQWVLSPASIVKFIADTRLYDGIGNPKQGETWWDFANPDPNTRAAFIWFEEAWVEINSWPVVGSPPGTVNYSALGFYVDGERVTAGQVLTNEDYSFSFTVNATGGYDFTYTPLTLKGKISFPEVVVADALTSAYRIDISPLVFSGVTYYMSPNVLDSETPLRVWKETSLQVVEDAVKLKDKTYQNPLLADINSGVADNWERIFLRLPPAYARDGREWSQVQLVAQDFTYFGTTLLLEKTECPPASLPPKIYDELIFYPPSQPYTGVIYDEPFLYSNFGVYANDQGGEDYGNAAIYPSTNNLDDTFVPGDVSPYDPLHDRRADLESPLLEGYGDWIGRYVQGTAFLELSGNLEDDVVNQTVYPIDPPVWDASIYKYPPGCAQNKVSYDVDVNSFKVGYAYFAADLSAAEDGFFDIQQDISLRDPDMSVRTGYVLPG